MKISKIITKILASTVASAVAVGLCPDACDCTNENKVVICAFKGRDFRTGPKLRTGWSEKLVKRTGPKPRTTDRSNYRPAVRESLLKGLKTFPDISKSPDIEDFMLVNNEITSLPRLANQERG